MSPLPPVRRTTQTAQTASDDETRVALDLLWAEFRRLNTLHFGGTLRLDEIRLSARKQYGGYCAPAKHLIVLSLPALRDHGFEETLDTFRHEVAHLVHPNHSAAFWDLARKLGSVNRYAKTPKTPNPNAARYVYECPVCAARVPRARAIRRSSCAKCDKSFNPRFLLKLVESPASRAAAEEKPQPAKVSGVTKKSAATPPKPTAPPKPTPAGVRKAFADALRLFER